MFKLAVLLLGLTICTVMPPFEGFDEFAHVSYVEQLADTGLPPTYEGTISQNIDDALNEGTVPYSVDGLPRSRHYDAVEAASLPDLQHVIHDAPDAPRHYVAGGGRNWQAQHPPLFYALTAPVWMATDGLSWSAQLFALRAAAWLIAWLGWIAGMRVLERNGQDKAARCLLWLPLFLPQFLPEFARYGNDSLCLLLMALLTGAALDYAKSDRGLAQIALYITLGLWTKALFLPVAAGIALWLLAYHGREKNFWRQAALPALGAVAAGGAWYAWRLHADGSLVGANEFVQLAQRGGLWPNLVTQFGWSVLYHGIAAIFVSFAWAGTWSLTHLPLVFCTGLLLPMGIALALYLKKLDPHDAAATLPLFVLLPVGGGLFYHLLSFIALTGGPGTPGWYVLILSPLLAVLAANADVPVRVWRWAGVYAACYGAVSWVGLILLYGGVLTRNAGNEFAPTGRSMVDGLRQLAVLGQPELAVFLLFSAILCLLLGKRATRR